jgi:SAM-dependent methyltransferase
VFRNSAELELLANSRWHSPAAEQNKGPILDVLKSRLPHTGLVLEIASGTGQHVVHFAQALPQLIWQPSEPEAEWREAIRYRVAAANLHNVNPPEDLNVLDRPWPINQADAILCSNMIHIAPWEATPALLEGAGQVLSNGGVLILYGPYRRFGRHTAPSNAAFDADLRMRNPNWGVRDLEEVARIAEQEGLDLAEVVEMPVNNFSVVFVKRDCDQPDCGTQD